MEKADIWILQALMLIVWIVPGFILLDWGYVDGSAGWLVFVGIITIISSYCIWAGEIGM